MRAELQGTRSQVLLEVSRSLKFAYLVHDWHHTRYHHVPTVVIASVADRIGEQGVHYRLLPETGLATTDTLFAMKKTGSH